MREEQGKILWVEDGCYLRMGFQSEDGKTSEKMIPVEQLLYFIEDNYDIRERCIDLKKEHQKIDKIKHIDRCRL